MIKKCACYFLALFLAGSCFLPRAASALVVSPSGASYRYSVTKAVQKGTVDLEDMQPKQGLSATYGFAGGSLSLTNAQIVTGNDKKGVRQHIRPRGVHPGENYLSIYGVSRSHEAGAAVFSFTSPVNTFSFTWGSIDRTNWMEVTNAKKENYTISGADILAQVSGLKAGKGTRLFSLTDLSGILMVVLRSTTNAMEVANISTSSVPLPAALPLFGIGLVGVMVARKRKSSGK